VAVHGATMVLLTSTTLATMVAALVTSTTAATSPCRQGLDYIDLIGGEPGVPVSAALGPRSCCGACGATAGCQSFTWIHRYGRDIAGLSAPPGCWLKMSGTPWQRRQHQKAVIATATATMAGAVPEEGSGPAPAPADSRSASLTPYYVLVSGDCVGADGCNASRCSTPTVAPDGQQMSAGCSDCMGGSVHPPIGGTLGDCPSNGNLLDGSHCALQCPDGFYADGPQPVCLDGALDFNVTCRRCTACRGITAPVNGGMGDCPLAGTLNPGHSCSQRCSADHVVADPSAQPRCLCGGLTRPTLNSDKVECKPCKACNQWAVFSTVVAVFLVVGGFMLLLRWQKYCCRRPSSCRNRRTAPCKGP
jgi:hypothetical protein